MKDFGTLIAKLRREKGLSQEEFAAAIGCTKQTISNYERNTRKPDYETLEAIADVFNVPMGFFLSEEERRAKLERIYRTYNINKTVSAKTGTSEDEELYELREQLRRNPDIRMLFSTAKNAKPEHIKAAAAMLNALKGNDNSLE